MSQFDTSKDYYGILGVEPGASPRDIERLYKRLAARHHPDRGGDEEEMKSLNEAYRVLKDETTRKDYDAQRQVPREATVPPVTIPTAQDVGMFGQGLTALLCLLLGFFLLFLVRFQWIWFLWPLAILAFIVLVFGVMLAHVAVLSFAQSLPSRNPFHRFRALTEMCFWMIVVGVLVVVYLLFTA